MRKASAVCRSEGLFYVLLACFVVLVATSAASVKSSLPTKVSCSASDDEPVAATGESCLLQQDPSLMARYRSLASLEEDPEVPASANSPSYEPARTSFVMDGKGTSDSTRVPSPSVNALRSTFDDGQEAQQHPEVQVDLTSLQMVNQKVFRVDPASWQMLDQVVDPEKLAVGLATASLSDLAIQTPAPTPPPVSTLAHSASSNAELPSLDVESAAAFQNDKNLKPWKQAAEMANAPWNEAVLALAGTSLAAAPSAGKAPAAPGKAPAAAAKAPGSAAKEAPTEAPKAATAASASAKQAAAEQASAPAASKQPSNVSEAAKAPTVAAKQPSSEAAKDGTPKAPDPAKASVTVTTAAPTATNKDAAAAAAPSSGTTGSIDLTPESSTPAPENATNESAVGSVIKWLVGPSTPSAPASAPAQAPNPNLVKNPNLGKQVASVKVDYSDHHVTENGCHCKAEWQYKDQLRKGCSITSMGPSWCEVDERGGFCSGGQRSEHGGSRWDYCQVAALNSPIVTRGGCHCLPHWKRADVRYHGCVESTPDRKFSWCYVSEDEELCPIAQRDEYGRLWDACWLLTDQDLAMLDSTVNNCHCQPEWEHDGVFMKGCAKTSNNPSPWCFVIEDERLCKKVSGVGEGKERLQRWDWCDSGDDKPDLVPKNPPKIRRLEHEGNPSSQMPYISNSETHSMHPQLQDSPFPTGAHSINSDYSFGAKDDANHESSQNEHSIWSLLMGLPWYATGFFASVFGCGMYLCCQRAR
eukprot:gnl/MRDRNA2_/MRDRNA2_34602_c0_seq1.p1 gnl/MRDRNA2_/MRDRNA2_34602_c0~~gnl/MRDRNA2_/MRDRNA2_34602_c0_seq1.p1  ORF type:complete len:754 (-),score=123.00 gnl/MRDRNA2_/MRDRNA2_34602_c0_seq1:18-2279(-)